MTYEIPLSTRPWDGSPDASSRVVTGQALRAHGVSPAEAGRRCRPGGPWQMLMPGVYLLAPEPPTVQERLRATLLYARRRRELPTQRGGSGAYPERADTPPVVDAMITGLTALGLYGFASAPPLPTLERIDVLVPHTRRLRSAGCARVVRGRLPLPEPREVADVPVAPVERALANAVAEVNDAATVHGLLSEAVNAGHCEAPPLVCELGRAELLSRPQVADAVDTLLARGRAAAEGWLYEMARTQDLPTPCWNVDLRLPDGSHLGTVDAYWPDHGVALEIDHHTAVLGGRQSGAEVDVLWRRYARKRGVLERLGLTVVHVSPLTLRDAPAGQAALVRTALMAAAGDESAEYVVVLPH